MEKYTEATKEELIKVIDKLKGELKQYHKYGTVDRIACDMVELGNFHSFDNYTYHDEVFEDVLNWLEVENEKFFPQFYKDSFELVDALVDELWDNDSITGNASGSYWFSSWKAASALAHNYDLLAEAMKNFGYEAKIDFIANYEINDVTIRCYLLRDSVEKAVTCLYRSDQYNHPEAKECYEYFKDSQDINTFFSRYIGSYENIEEAAEDFGLSKEDLKNNYSVHNYPNGVCIQKKVD